QNDQDSLGDVPIEIVELVLGEDGAGGIVGVGQVNDFGAVVDFACQCREVVMPIAIGDRAIFHATRFGQYLKADERGLGGKNLVLIAQKRADDIGHDAFRPAAGDDVVSLEVELLGQNAAQVQAAIGIKMQALYGPCHGLQR